MTTAPAHHARDAVSVRAAVLTVSDTRTAGNDVSGAAIRRLMTANGHQVCDYAIRHDESALVRECVLAWCTGGDCDIILISGGTGLAYRDTTIEALNSLFDKRIDGFGELFRMLSHHEIGAAAMLSRAVAGTHGRTAIFCMPGAPPAVTLAMEKLILPALPHLVSLLRG